MVAADPQESPLQARPGRKVSSGLIVLVTLPLEAKTWARVVLHGRDKVIVDVTALMALLPNGTPEAAVNTSHTVHAFQTWGCPSAAR